MTAPMREVPVRILVWASVILSNDQSVEQPIEPHHNCSYFLVDNPHFAERTTPIIYVGRRHELQSRYTSAAESFHRGFMETVALS